MNTFLAFIITFLVVCILSVILCIVILNTCKKKKSVNIVQRQKSNKNNSKQVQVGVVISDLDRIDADELSHRLSTIKYGDDYMTFLYGCKKTNSNHINDSFTYTTCEYEDNNND